MEPLYTFAGNGLGGSVALRIFQHHVEHEHKNYLVSVPFNQIETVTYSKNPGSTYASIDMGPISFGCDNKGEVYAAVMHVMASRLGG